MAATTPIDQLSAKLDKILSDYADDIKDNVQDIVKKTVSAGVSAIKRSAPRSKGAPNYGSKHYADQWAAKNEVSRLGASAVIYNKNPTYRLSHLLENGHAKRGGGRVTAIPHIKPVEEQIIRQVESEIKRVIQ